MNINTDRIIASIVTYNPNLDLLYRNIQSIYSQVKYIVIIDNGSDNKESIERVALSITSNIGFIFNDINQGIAKALNQATFFALDNNYDALLTLDQDSIVENGFVGELAKGFTANDIAICCSVVIDRNISTIMQGSKNIDTVQKQCITSGSLNLVKRIIEVGGFDEEMFIDGVDFEFCRRIRRAGYRIYCPRNAILYHSIGNGRLIKVGPVQIYVLNHSPIRKYYRSRNTIYVSRKYNESILMAIIRDLYILFITLLFESDKLKKCFAILSGIKDGIIIKMD